MADPTIIIDFEPDWGNPPMLTYSLETALQSTPYFVEQRRPILPVPDRILNCQFGFSKQHIQRARNVLLAGSNKSCCVPIYSEPIRAAAFSGSSITATTDLTYLWNIQNCGYAVLLDLATGQSEMLKVSGVVGQVISLSAAITKTWTAAQTVLYPAFKASLDGLKSGDITSVVGVVEAKFKELVETSGDATEEYVGVTDRICQELLYLYGVWVERRPIDDNDYQWSGLDCSESGARVYVARSNGSIYRSSDYGSTWSAVGGSRQWYTIATSGNGKYVLGTTYTRLYLSSNYGANWSEIRPAGDVNRLWYGAAISSSGQVMLATTKGYRAYISKNYGASWDEIQPDGNSNFNWTHCCISADGQTLVVSKDGTNIYVSMDQGASWLTRTPKSGGFYDNAMAANATCSVIVVTVDDGHIYISTNYGANWTERKPHSSAKQYWRGASCSAVGDRIIVSCPPYVYLSMDFGATWAGIVPSPGTMTYGIMSFNAAGKSIVIASQRSFSGRVWTYYAG